MYRIKCKDCQKYSLGDSLPFSLKEDLAFSEIKEKTKGEKMEMSSLNN
jgi:hypothetical protein